MKRFNQILIALYTVIIICLVTGSFSQTVFAEPPTQAGPMCVCDYTCLGDVGWCPSYIMAGCTVLQMPASDCGTSGDKCRCLYPFTDYAQVDCAPASCPFNPD